MHFRRMPMTETELTHTDKKRIKDEIKVTLIIGLLLTTTFVVFIFIVPIILTIFNKPKDGFIGRGLMTIGLLSLPVLAISRKNIIKYVDLCKGKKITFKTSDYEIKKEKDR